MNYNVFLSNNNYRRKTYLISYNRNNKLFQDIYKFKQLH